ncbi:MAG: CPBP family intramembrane metalloprotease [Phycisphaerales bacterium]|nr:CPBP family intramembrane metalloprotease [Phycisphaerales bacterium]
MPDTAPAPTPVPGPTPSPGPRFCTACGRPLAQDAACPCLASIATSAAEPGLSPQQRPLRLALRLYFALLGVSAMATILYIAAGGPDAPPRQETAIDIAASALFALITLAACIPGRALLRPALSRAGHPAFYPLAVITAGGTYMLASSFTGFFSRAFDLESESYTTAYVEAGYPGWVPLVMIAVFPGVFEELAFRGLIGSSMRSVLESREALIVTALLFAILHLSPVSIPHLFIIGLALGLLRSFSGSLYPGMLMHFTHNALVVLSEYYPESFP